MKKKIWLLLVLVLVLACAAGYFIFKKPADVQIDEEHFPDSAFREAVTAFDLDQDGKLSGEEIKKIEYLNIAKKGIASLQGVEYLTEVKNIYADDNERNDPHGGQNTVPAAEGIYDGCHKSGKAVCVTF